MCSNVDLPTIPSAGPAVELIVLNAPPIPTTDREPAPVVLAATVATVATAAAAAEQKRIISSTATKFKPSLRLCDFVEFRTFGLCQVAALRR